MQGEGAKAEDKAAEEEEVAVSSNAIMYDSVGQMEDLGKNTIVNMGFAIGNHLQRKPTKEEKEQLEKDNSPHSHSQYKLLDIASDGTTTVVNVTTLGVTSEAVKYDAKTFLDNFAKTVGFKAETDYPAREPKTVGTKNLMKLEIQGHCAGIMEKLVKLHCAPNVSIILKPKKWLSPRWRTTSKHSSWSRVPPMYKCPPMPTRKHRSAASNGISGSKKLS